MICIILVFFYGIDRDIQLLRDFVNILPYKREEVH